MTITQIPAYLGFDCETTGLNPHGTPAAGLLEIGLIAYTANLESIASWASIVASPVALAHRAIGVDPFVDKMHTDNGLWEELNAADQSQLTPELVEKAALEWMTSNHIPWGLPMLGSSITLDRDFLAAEMPQLLDAFHYRSVDATSLKLAALITAGVASEELTTVNDGHAAHRALADITHSAEMVRRTLHALASSPALVV